LPTRSLAMLLLTMGNEGVGVGVVSSGVTFVKKKNRRNFAEVERGDRQYGNFM